MKVNQVKAGAVLNYVIIALNTLLGLLYTPYMLRCLGQNEYGLYSLVSSIIAYLTLLDFGFGTAVIRFTAKYRAEGKLEEQYSLFGLFITLFSIISVLSLIAGGFIYANVDTLFDQTMTPEELSKARIMMILLIINLAVTFPFSIFGAIIQAYEDFVFQKLLNISRIILSTAVIVALLVVGYKAIALVVVHTIFNIATLLINYFYCRRKIKIKIKFRRFKFDFIKELMGFSVWVFLGEIMSKFYYSTGQFVLGAICGTIEVAVYAVAITLQQMYIMFSTAISSVLLPRITSMVAKGVSEKEISDLFIRTGRIQFIIMGFVLSGFILFGQQFIDLWAGEGYGDAYIITLMLFLTCLPPLIQNTAISILQARNQQRARSVILLVVSALGVVLQVILAKSHAAIGCGFAVALANLVGQGLILNVYYCRSQHLDILKFWREIGKMAIVPMLLVAIGIYILSKVEIVGILQLGVSIVVFSVVYLSLFWKFSLNNSERELLWAPMQKALSKFKR